MSNEQSSESSMDKSKKRKIKIISIIGGVCLAILAIYLFNVYRVYDSYRVVDTTKIESGTNSHYKAFGEFVVKYSNDGISYIKGGDTVWNEAYEMKSPIVDICGNYLAIADKNSNMIYVFNTEGRVGIVNTSYPIIKLEVAKQGVVAALLEEAKANYIEVYDKEGSILVSHKTLLNENGFPLSFSLSDNGQKMVASYLSIKAGETSNKLMFYNFSDVGKDEVDRVVGSFDQYGETIVPAVYFLSDENAIAIGENILSIYKMREKPQLKKEITFENEIQKVFYNQDYIGFILANDTTGYPYRVEVYSIGGTKVMSKELNMEFKNAKFAGKNVLLYNDLNCRMVSLKGVVKFDHTFKKTISEMIPMEGQKTYLVITKNKIQEIKLK